MFPLPSAGPGEWFDQTVVETGRLPLFCLFAGMLAGFAFIRFSTRMIRAGVSWWPGNIEFSGSGRDPAPEDAPPEGLHIHHVVFGVLLMVIAGVTGFALPVQTESGWRAATAALFGIGTALVLDEFALILRLRDVYWAKEGRDSVVAVFAALAVIGLLLLGERPVVVRDLGQAVGEGTPWEWALDIGLSLFNLALVAVTMLKGKYVSGFVGLFFPVVLLVTAVRLARPRAPWARRRYHRGPGGEPGRKLRRALRREERWHGPLARARVRAMDFVAGRHDGAATG
ncbi:hypothetical protein [Streptomyces aidingensis]|uniref:Integral membrane protein n=1 Tax=Streptomyces aidingensis TaxID=910347 RepID=A0A1I1HNW9_9ACTN|nr:hypothetical protein [Streptomyces aidingensis]SFC25807.1 hypothetical protein SAMN05421773_102472 [Streptomyces aidingensis]